MGWKEREKGKENRGRGLKENRKQGSWEKGQIELGRERKLIKMLILVERYIKHQAIQIMDSLS